MLLVSGQRVKKFQTRLQKTVSWKNRYYMNSLWDSVFQSSFCSKTKGVSRTITNQCYIYLRKLTYELIKELMKDTSKWLIRAIERTSSLLGVIRPKPKVRTKKYMARGHWEVRLKNDKRFKAQENATDELTQVLYMIGGDGGVSFLDQSQDKVRQSQGNSDYFRHFIGKNSQSVS